MKNSCKSILVIQTAFIGDVIMSTPIYKGLKKIYPEAAIDVLVARQNHAILANNPHIRTIYTIDKNNLIRKIIQLCRLIVTFRKNRYDLAVSLQIHFTNSLLMFFSDIEMRLGVRRQKLLTHTVSLPKGIHIRERIGLLLQRLSDLQFDLTTELFPTSGDQKIARSFIRKDQRIKIGIAPGSVWETKKWPLEYYQDLIRSLPKSIGFYLIGGKDDEPICQELLHQNPDKEIVNATGKLTILQSAALIKEMDLMITNDSAPLHIANAMNTPVFAFFGPTVKRFGCYPYREKDRMLEVQLSCRPCGKHGSRKCPLGHHDCLRLIKPMEVKKMILDFVNG